MKNKLFLKLSILFTLVFSIASTINAVGVLDKTFGTNGRASADFGNAAGANATVIQPDGKIIVVGYVSRVETQVDVALARFNPNGTIDTSFGNGGKIIIAFSQFNENAFAVALAPDGKIVMAGNIGSQTGTSDFLVARFTQSGNLDTTFGTGGVVTVNQGSTDIFHAVAVQPDGKIVASGYTSDGDRAAVIRFNTNGTLDGSFADGGLFYLALSSFAEDETFYAVALYPNGRILLGGTAYNNNNSSGIDILALLETNGTLAQDFGTNGIKVEFAGSSLQGFVFDLAILPDGKFLAVSRLAIRRYQSNGTYDMTFRHSFTSAGSDISFAGSGIAVRSDGRFFVTNQIAGLPAVVAYNNDGRDIHSFRISSVSDIAIQSDNKFVLISTSGNNFVVTRYVSVNSPATRIADFDFDEKTDLAVSRTGLNVYVYVLRSTQSVVSYTMQRNTGEGVRSIPEAFHSPSFEFPLFYWRYSSQNTPAYFDSITEGGTYATFQWGISGDIPVGGDYDGETIRFSFYRKSTELTIFRPSTGTWWIYNRLTNTASAIQWGISGDKPVPADYDYDGITDIAIYRPSTGTWWIRRSSDGASSAIRWGIASDIPLTGDFDGDGKADLTVYRASEGNWYQLLTTEGFRVVRFGISTDAPVPGDYDGDGRHDVAVFRNGVWYILQSTEGLKIVQWGISGDSPVAVRYDQ